MLRTKLVNIGANMWKINVTKNSKLVAYKCVEKRDNSPSVEYKGYILDKSLCPDRVYSCIRNELKKFPERTYYRW